MPRAWRRTTLGEVADVFDGPHATPKKTTWGPWYLSISSLVGGRLDLSASARISESDFVAWTKRVQVQRGDTLFSYETRLGEAAYWGSEDRAALGRRMGLLRPRPKVDPRFLTYAYLGPDFQNEIRKRTISGATVDRLPIATIATWPISLPPLAEQRRIAGVLGSLDDLIEANQRLMRSLETLAQALYDQVVGEVSSLVGTRSLSSTVEILSGGTPKTSESAYWGGDIPWFSVVDAPGPHEVWVCETAKSITPAGLAGSPTQLLPKRASIISARGTVGKMALVAVPMTMNQSCYALVSKVGARGAFTYFSVKGAVAELQRNAHGSVFDTITRDTFDQIQVPDVPLNRIAQYEAVAAPVLDQVLECLIENRQLREARDELLPLLLSGAVTVDEVVA